MLSGSVACARSTPGPETVRSAPQPIPVAAPRLYAGQAGKGSLNHICEVDPEACPKLDFDREAARDVKEEVYAVEQSAAPGPGLGLFAAAPPVPASAPAQPPQPIQVGKTRAS